MIALASKFTRRSWISGPGSSEPQLYNASTAASTARMPLGGSEEGG